MQAIKHKILKGLVVTIRSLSEILDVLRNHFIYSFIFIFVIERYNEYSHYPKDSLLVMSVVILVYLFWFTVLGLLYLVLNTIELSVQKRIFRLNLA